MGKSTHTLVPARHRVLVGIDANLENIVKQGEERSKREGRHKQRNEAKLRCMRCEDKTQVNASNREWNNEK